MMNLTENAVAARLNAAAASAGTTITSASIELTDDGGDAFEGLTVFCELVTFNAGNLVTVEESDDDVAFTAVANATVNTAANGELAVIELFRPAKRYYRVVVDRSGANTAVSDIWAIKHLARDVPVTWPAAAIKLVVYPG